MLPLRWRSAAPARGLLQPPPTLRLRGSLAPASRAWRQRAALLGRGDTSTPRALGQQPASTSRSFQKFAVKSQDESASSLQNVSARTILHSAFPTKTVISLAIIGGLAYFFIEVREETWVDMILATSENEEHNTNPVHFNTSKDDLDHWLQYHVANASVALKDPKLAQFISATFNNIASGWMIGEDEAADDYIPVTHGCRYQSNTLCEDLFALGTNPGPGEKPWNYWSIMDGHAGFQTAMFLQRSLIPHVARALANLPDTSGPMEVERVIKETFLRVDRQIMDDARTAANWYPAANAAASAALGPALSGSCALLAAFDPEKSTLRVACTGDSRAVLGRWDESTNSYKCIPLSEDQTGFNPKEVSRLAEAHPDEPDIIDPKTGRLMGIAITRAFGDHRWKWDNDFIKTVQEKFWGSAPRPLSKTPPYMTAEPEVTETEIVRVDPKGGRTRGKSDFLIMASDGLWDRISSEHAVECVNRWLDAKARGNGSVTADPQLRANPPYFGPAHTLEPGVEIKDGEVDWKATPEYFAIEDENAAVCLVRNAMGGTRRNLFLGLISMTSPVSRNAVDDTTVLVVFFDELGERKEGKVAAGREKGGSGSKWWMPTRLLGLGNKDD
ncbi:hypothetical protein NX059_009325 [Plenodomus lindquistii]|nr:hypothetical protein NX059_009325 [Plenodomus lindquistii]